MKWKLVALASALVVVLGAILYPRVSLARRGEEAFTRLGCSGCHFSGAGPNLTHVLSRHNEAFLRRFIQDPSSIYRERNGQTLNPGYMPMPNLGVSDEDVNAILAYLKELNKQ